MKPSEHYYKVKNLLEEKPEYRDSDLKLLSRIWYEEAGSNQNMNVVAFLTNFRNGKYSKPESITRARRKVQENNEHLRGDKWQERQDKQDDVKDDLRTLFD